MDITAKCICENHCLALDGYDLNSVHKLNSKEKKILAEPEFEHGSDVWEAAMLPLSYEAPQVNQDILIKYKQLKTENMMFF